MYPIPKDGHKLPIQAQTEVKSVEDLEKPNKSLNVHSDDYEAKYPEDDYLEEAGDEARVWRVYLDEKRAEDDNLLKVWRETVDILLVFAALFSAVVTTFVVQSSQALQQDYTFVAVSLLTELVAIQRAQASGEQVSNIPHSLVNASSPFSADPLSAWVNGLWFISLSLSLLVALISVLIKQWLLQYPLPTSCSPHEQVKIRQFRYVGLQDWWVPAIVGSLPALLHLSLLIFLAGLVLYLRPLNVALPWVILGLTGISYFIYFITPLIPLKYPQCPYKSPLTEVAGEGMKLVSSALLLIFKRATPWLEYLPSRHWLAIEGKLKRRLQAICEGLQEKLNLSSQNQETLAIQKDGELLSVQALETMRGTSSNLSLHNIALEAYSGLVDKINDDTHGVILRNKKLLPDLEDAFFSCFSFEDHNSAKAIEKKERKAERLGRAILRLRQGKYSQETCKSRLVSCWNSLQECKEPPQSMTLALLAKSAGTFYRKDYGYVTLEVGNKAFLDVCHQLLGCQLSSWVWNELQEQVIKRDLSTCFDTKSDLFEAMKLRINKLSSKHDLHAKYTILVLHSLGCTLRADCPELRSQNRNSSALLIHALVGVLEQCDHDTLMVFCHHLYKMIVVDLDWFDGGDEKNEEANNDSSCMKANALFKSYQKNLLVKLETVFETEMQNEDLCLKGLSYNDVLVVPELCFELHHRIHAGDWNKNLMLKALRCLEIGWDLTRSTVQFLVDCFDSGLHSNVVEIFEERNGLDTLLLYLGSKNTADTRARARKVLIHYYTAVAQKSPVDARRIFEYDFECLREYEVFPEVVEGVFKLLQSTWLTNSERIKGLRRGNVGGQQTFQIYSETFYPSDLTDNFIIILGLYAKYNSQNFWRHIIECISGINKSGPPPFELRNQFISTFEAIEDLKIKVKAEGYSYDLYFSMPKEEDPVNLGKDRIKGPCFFKYTSGILTHNAMALISAASDSGAGEEDTLLVRPSKVALRFSTKVRDLVSCGNRSLGNHPPV